MVCHDVSEGEAQTFIVLWDVQNRSDVSASHGHGLWVLAPNRSVDHGCVVQGSVELLDERLGSSCSCCSHSDNELGSDFCPGGGDLDQELLSAAQYLNVGVVAVIYLQKFFDFSGNDVCVGNNVILEFTSFELSSLSTDLSGFQGAFNPCKVNRNGPLGQVDQFLHRYVLEWADGAQVNVTL